MQAGLFRELFLRPSQSYPPIADGLPNRLPRIGDLYAHITDGFVLSQART
jgi:hypothetical protein